MKDSTYPYPLEELMAIAPGALGRAFARQSEGEEYAFARLGSVAVVRIEGPLVQRGGFFWDGYEAIQGRFWAALSDPEVRSVLLRINSPGGVASGCFEAVRAMRRAKMAAGKPVVAFADEAAYSAAYALATVADEIYLPEPGGVGSVGVIGLLFDQTAFNDKLGFKVVVVASGGLKADGHPDVPLTPEVVERYQVRINELGKQFAELVGEARGMTAAEVLELEAACLYGKEAVRKGLASGVKSFDDALRAAESMGRKAQKSNSPQGMEQGMKLIAMALGLGPEATESDAAERASALKNIEAELVRRTGTHSAEHAFAALDAALAFGRDVLSLAGKASTREALGVLAAHKAAAEQLPGAREEVASLRTEIERRDRRSLIEQGKAEGKLNPALEQWAAAQPLETLESYLASAPTVVPGSSERHEPAKGSSPAAGSPVPDLDGKRWEDLSYADKHNLYVTNKALYDALKTDHERRKGGTT